MRNQEGREGATSTGGGGLQEGEEEGGKVAVMPLSVGLGLFEMFALQRIPRGRGWRVHAVGHVRHGRDQDQEVGQVKELVPILPDPHGHQRPFCSGPR